MITLIAKENIMMVLAKPQVRQMIERVREVSPSVYSFVDIVAKLEAGEFQLWLLHEEFELKLIMITEIELWPKMKRLRVEMMSGEDYDSYGHHLSELKTWAKQHRCREIVSSVRPGFSKKLKKQGFRVLSMNVQLQVE